MLKNRFKDEIVEPSVTVKKIKGKARLHLCFWVFLFVVSGLMYWASLFTVVDLPTLSSIAQSSPISLELTVKTPSSSIDGAFDTVTSSLFLGLIVFIPNDETHVCRYVDNWFRRLYIQQEFHVISYVDVTGWSAKFSTSIAWN